jgi:hypothetical protein
MSGDVGRKCFFGSLAPDAVVREKGKTVVPLWARATTKGFVRLMVSIGETVR